MAAHFVALQEAQARRGRHHLPDVVLSGRAVRRLFRLCGSDGIGSPEIADGAAADSLDRRAQLQTVCVCVEGDARSAYVQASLCSRYEHKDTGHVLRPWRAMA